ncbi:MAG: LysM peptidoglycan-binding domain-containing protein, partial [bacterium]|nr:LysM peptidoglycan-binding domain-containing protein [bacterium]
MGKLLRKGDWYFELEQYTLPRYTNAFNYYKAVLAIEPSNTHARLKIYEIVQKYKTWGDEHYRINDAKALQYYQEYLPVAQYILSILNVRGIKIKIKQVQTRIKEITRRLKTTPAPVSTPIPLYSPAPPPPTTIPIVPGTFCEYIVRPGDTLRGIARFYTGTSDNYTTIQAFNGLTSDIIHPGNRLRIPKKLLLRRYQACDFGLPAPAPTRIPTPGRTPSGVSSKPISTPASGRPAPASADVRIEKI